MDKASSSSRARQPTIYDVAEHARVSTATVSRALNGTGRLNPETVQKVMRSVAALNYVPSTAARQLSTRKTKVIALAFVRDPEERSSWPEDESLLYIDSVIRGAELASQRYGYSLLLSGSSDLPSTQALTALAGTADGVMVLGRAFTERRAAALAKRAPLVMLAGNGRCRSAVNIRADNAAGMRALVEHLAVEHGARRFAFMSGTLDSPDNAARAATLLRTVARYGGEVEPAGPAWSGAWTAPGASRALALRLRSAMPLPDVIVCASDPMALGALEVLHAAGLRVPEDIKVTGFDDIPLARYVDPALTTVRQPAQQLGSAGVEALMELMRGLGVYGSQRVMPVELVTRRSCGCAAPTAPGRGLLRS